VSVGAPPVVGPGVVELEMEPVGVVALIVVPVGEVTVPEPTPVGPVTVPDPEEPVEPEPVEPKPAEPAPELEPSVLPVGAGLGAGVSEVLPVP
jgi:hypothetical protein